MKNRRLLLSVFTLGSASLIDYAIQLILPIALVRLLVPEQYAQYRLLFLMVNTAMALAPMYMPQSLFYFFPRAQSVEERGVILGNVLLFLMITGGMSGLIVYPGFGFFPDKFYEITQEKFLIPFFILTWVISTVIDVLPNALNKIRSQAIVMLSLSLLRVFAVVFSAWYTGKVEYVFYALCLFSVVKVLVLFGYAHLSEQLGTLSIKAPAFKEQLSYALPFGIAGGLYMLKVQADQWIAAYQFSPKEYAVFTFGIYIAPLMTVLRTAINNAVLPEMSSAYAANQHQEVASIFRKSNFLMALFIMPLLAVLYAIADSLINILFTSEYAGAASIMRLYIIGFVAQCLETNSILRLINAGKFWIKLNMVLLVVAVVTSYAGSVLFGLVGAALGSVITLFIGESVSLFKAARGLGLALSGIIQWRRWSILLGASVLSALLGQVVAAYMDGVGLFQMMTVALSVLIAYLLMAFLFLPLRMQDLSLMIRGSN